MTNDEMYMARCIQLARNGMQNSQPNPMVGAVIVHGGRVIGEGYHIRCGEGHAEVNACASVRKEDEHLLRESTIYVSLEPCSHYGKTPPCAELLVRKGFKRCVIGCVDPFAKVSGRGIQMLRDAGIEVTVGVLEDECKALNSRFMTFHGQGRPFVTLKWAESRDGFIDGHISSSYTQMLCHKRRAEHQAILVGRRTYEVDSPTLTTREWYGPSPRRYVASSQPLSLTEGFTLLQTSDVRTMLDMLHADGVQTVLVEGGARLLQSFIDSGLWDECYVERGVSNICGQVKAPSIEPRLLSSTERFMGRTIVCYKNSWVDTIINKYYPDGGELRRTLLTHSRMVAQKALRIVDSHPELQADRQFVEEAAMLHDIGIFRCDAAGIQCFGTEPYICHGTIGAEIMRSEGHERHARVCERHTGTGLTALDIRQQNLPLEPRDLLPETIEEQIVCYADKFFSKTRPTEEKTFDRAARSLEKFGAAGVERFKQWKKLFE